MFLQSSPHVAQPYDWNRQWYPLAFVHDLDPGTPHPMELLGKRLVLWRDSSNEWHCFLDRCPHRLAPLSGESTHITILDVSVGKLGRLSRVRCKPGGQLRSPDNP
jgi:nitrite reductase/ring-hydroxylating ferredoxin subunit